MIILFPFRDPTSVVISSQSRNVVAYRSLFCRCYFYGIFWQKVGLRYRIRKSLIYRYYYTYRRNRRACVLEIKIVRLSAFCDETASFVLVARSVFGVQRWDYKSINVNVNRELAIHSSESWSISVALLKRVGVSSCALWLPRVLEYSSNTQVVN